jgi:hypothetical protein
LDWSFFRSKFTTFEISADLPEYRFQKKTPIFDKQNMYDLSLDEAGHHCSTTCKTAQPFGYRLSRFVLRIVHYENSPPEAPNGVLVP